MLLTFFMGGTLPPISFHEISPAGSSLTLLQYADSFMFVSANYAQTAYGQMAYGRRGVAAYAFSTSEPVAGSDTPASQLQLSDGAYETVASFDASLLSLHANVLAASAVTAHDVSAYNSFTPIGEFVFDGENRQQTLHAESRQPSAVPENRLATATDKRHF